MLTVTVREKVRFAETDMMGVAHHANFFRWYEMGRVECLRQAGVLLNDLLSAGIVFPIRDVNCRYLIPARFDDEIDIEATLSELSQVKMIFAYRLLRASDGKVLATGSTCNAFTDTKGKIVRLPELWYNKLKVCEDNN